MEFDCSIRTSAGWIKSKILKYLEWLPWIPKESLSRDNHFVWFKVFFHCINFIYILLVTFNTFTWNRHLQSTIKQIYNVLKYKVIYIKLVLSTIIIIARDILEHILRIVTYMVLGGWNSSKFNILYFLFFFDLRLLITPQVLWKD